MSRSKALVTNKAVDLGIEGVKIEGPSLIINGDISKKGLEELGIKLKVLHGANQFWIGDWANFLIKKYGKGTMTQMAELIGYAPETVHKYAQISNKYDSRSRLRILKENPKVLHGHFQEALMAPSPEYELENLPDNMTVKQLRAQIKTDKEMRENAASSSTPSTPVRFSWIRDFRVVEAEQGVNAIRTAVRAIKESKKDEAVGTIILKNFKRALRDLGKEF